jgi:hypothetical protein
MDTKRPWYCKWVNQAGAAGGVQCPACGAGFPIDIAFDNAPRWCVSCKKELMEWNFLRLILVIDPEAAPPLVKHIIDFIRPMADFEAEEAMTELFHLLDRKADAPATPQEKPAERKADEAGAA